MERLHSAHLVGIRTMTAKAYFHHRPWEEVLCGIAAILYKTGESTSSQAVGLQLREMLYSMRHRGVDSTGVNIAGQHFGPDYVVRVVVSEDQGATPVIEGGRNAVAALGGSVLFSDEF